MSLRVSVSVATVRTFARSWPCSGLGDVKSPIRFEYDARGDLVDIEGEPVGADGGAMVALSHDAQERAGQVGYTIIGGDK